MAVIYRRMYPIEGKRNGKKQSQKDMGENGKLIEKCRNNNGLVVSKKMTTSKKLVGKKLIDVEPHNYIITAEEISLNNEHRFDEKKSAYKLMIGTKIIKYYLREESDEK